jgi:hypothetical protein
MRFPVAVLCAFTFLSIASPQDDMNELIDAVYRADGEAVFRSLTLENRQALSMMVTMFRLAPGEVAEQLRQELQVQLSTSEISCMREEDLVRIILDSPMFRNEIPWPRHMVSIESCSMAGDTALVTVTIEGEPNSYSYPMILQEGSWKLATEFFPEN